MNQIRNGFISIAGVGLFFLLLNEFGPAIFFDAKPPEPMHVLSWAAWGLIVAGVGGASLASLITWRVFRSK